MRSGGHDRHRRISFAAALVGVFALTAGGLTAVAVTGGLPRSLGAPTPGLPLASLPATSACAAAGACDLYAKAGSTTAGSASVNFWGFTLDNSVPSQLAGYVDSTSGLPVNTIIMNAAQSVTLTLHNALPAGAGALSLEFPAKTGVPDATGAPEAGTAAYTLSGLAPGTYVYEAGPTVNQARQLSMGLSGLIIVRPAGYHSVPTPTTVNLTITAIRTDGQAVIAPNTANANIVNDPAAVTTDVGLAVSGPGIPAGATISNVGPDATTTPALTAGQFMMSAAAVPTGVTIGQATDLAPYPRTDAGAYVTPGSTTVTDPDVNPADAGKLVVGPGIPAGSVVGTGTVGTGTFGLHDSTDTTAVLANPTGVTITLPPRSDPAYTVAGSPVVKDTLTASADLGAAVSGPGVPAGATITNVVPGVEFTMSAPATVTSEIAPSTTAYGTGASAFDQEALVVATELDPLFTAAPLANDVDNYTPRAFFLNGKAHPSTDDIGVQAGKHVLLHMANLGIRDHALGLVNQRMSLIGDDSTPVAHPKDIATKLLTPGEVSDVTTLVDPDAGFGQQFALLDYGRHLHNSGDNPSLTGALGGMLTFLDVVIPTVPVPGGPVAHVSVITPATNDGSSPETVSVTYAGTVSNAYWFVDNITATPVHTIGTTNGTYSIAIADIKADLPVGGSGDHVIWIQPYNGSTPGTPSGAVFTLSLTGPIVGALSIDPAYTNLTTTVNHVGANPAGADTTIAPTDIVVTGSAEPSLVDWTVDAAEICMADPSTAACTGGIPLAVGAATAPSFTYPLSANIAVTNPAIAALSNGPHTLYIHSHEQPGAGGGTARWGASSQIVLTIDRATGPTTTFTTVSPDPAGIADNPGNINFLESVRFNVHLQDAISPIANAELFLYSAPTAAELGTGSQLRAVGGAWLTANSMDAYIDVPNAELLSNPQGTIDAYVVAQDAAGNWGAPAKYTLRLDKTRPVINSATLNSTAHTISVSATDPTGVPPATVPMTSKVVMIEYLINIGAESVGGADDCITGPCLVDVPVTVPADTISQTVTYIDPGLAIIDIQVRVRDGAGNWSDYVKLTP